MASIYDISSEDLTQSEEFLKSLLKSHPDTASIDTSSGGGITDLILRAWSLFYAYFKLTISETRFRQSLLKVDELPEEERSEAIQELLSNFFLELKTGDKSQGKARIVSSQPFNFVFDPPEDYVFTRSGSLTFIPLEASVVNSLVDGTFEEEVDENGESEYIYELNLVATSPGLAFDISPGEFEDYPELSPYIKRVENARDFAGGKGDENVDELKNRGPLAVSTRDLVSEAAIQTTLLNEFSQVKFVDVVGGGDNEMQRDLKETSMVIGETQLIHMLGHIDIYVGFELSQNSELSSVVAVQETTQGPLTGIALPSVPIFAIKRVYNRTLLRELVSGEFERVTMDFNYTNSNGQEMYVRVSDVFIGDTLEVVYDTALGFDPVAAFISSDERRNLCSNSLVKAKYPIYLILDFTYEMDATLPDLDEGEVKSALVSFVKTLNPNKAISNSIFSKFLQENFTDISAINSPFIIVGDMYKPDGTIFRGFSVDKFSVPNDFDLGYSQKTVAYYLVEENITINRRS